jgi:cell division septation protein DedD
MSQTGGEKELILGNKQLISLFFIVVALCGVFFAMGYMVRGSSLKGSVSTTGDSTTAASDGVVKRQQPEPPRETTDASPADSTPSNTAGTHPAQDATQDMPQSQPATTPAGASTEPKPVQKVDVTPAPFKPELARTDMAKPDTAKTDTSEAGASYVQVSALGLTDAEALVRTLREQHLPAGIAPSSKEGLYRVRVGPYHTTADVSEAKTRLKTLGFSNTIVQKQ